MKLKKFFKEYKNFAARGNAIDLAIGLVIGTAFTAIVNAIVAQIIMPLISLITRSADFTEWQWVIVKGAEDGTGKVAIGYGVLIQAILNFIIITFVLFLVLKVLNGSKQVNKEFKEKHKALKGIYKEKAKEKGSRLTLAEKHEIEKAFVEQKALEEKAKQEEEAKKAEEAKIDKNTLLLQEIVDLLKKNNSTEEKSE